MKSYTRPARRLHFVNSLAPPAHSLQLLFDSVHHKACKHGGKKHPTYGYEARDGTIRGTLNEKLNTRIY